MSKKEMANEEKMMMNERAILAQKEAEEKMAELAEKHKKEKEEIQVKITEWEEQFDARQKVIMEIEQLRAAKRVTKRRIREKEEELAGIPLPEIPRLKRVKRDSSA